jgi:glycerol-3-phosphate dehydrogenase
VVTITGGKLTTYREMAQDTVDAVVELLGTKARCRTKRLALVGATRRPEPDPGTPEAHLIGRYGTMSDDVRAIFADEVSLGEPLVPGLPYLRAEAVYAARHEMARTLDDVLARRTRARLFDRSACVAAAPAVADLLASELGWDAEETQRQLAFFLTSCSAEDDAAHLDEIAATS